MSFCRSWGGDVPRGHRKPLWESARVGTDGHQAAFPLPSVSFPPGFLLRGVSPACTSCSTQVWIPFPEEAPWRWSPARDGFIGGRAPRGTAGRCWCEGEPAASALRGFTEEIRHSAELPSVIAPLTIRGCAGNFGAADRYTALIQLSLQPLLAKIRGNWNYK